MRDQQAWFRVPKATPVRLCLTEMHYSRTGLPYLTAEYLTVRRQGADVAIRETAAEPSRGVATAGVPER